MNKNVLYVAAVYFSIISLVSIIVTVADKSHAKRQKWRTPEKTLLLLGFFGGALSEYITMKVIRHKTQHKKFMIGLPTIMVFHVVLLAVYLYFSH